MFSKETYMARRAKLKQTIGSGLLLFLGNDESGMNYADNTYHFRQDSTFLYFFGLPYAGLSAIIDIDNDKEIIFGDELTIDAIVWMGTQPTLKEKSEAAGIKAVDLCTEKAAIFPSKGEMRKLVQSGGVSFNKEKLAEVDTVIDCSSLLDDKYLLVQRGKKNYYLLIAK